MPLKDGYTLYLGDFLDEEIVQERGIPSRNAAGANRIARLGSALKVAELRPIILSPGTSLRARHVRGFLSQPRARSIGGVPVVFAAALSPGFLNVFGTFFFLLAAIERISRHRRINAAIVYNFSPPFVLISAYLRLFKRIPIIHNVEDVSEPKLADWMGNKEVRPLQQLIFFVCMRLIASLATAYILPTRQFLRYLPTKKFYVVTPGCICPQARAIASTRAIASKSACVRLLFSGKLEFEHGIDILVEALHIVAKRGHASRLNVDICGAGPAEGWLLRELRKLAPLAVCYHGFVSDQQYQVLLNRADICVALQKPLGRYGTMNSPSKVYEYLGYGKTVISTLVGEIGAIPRGAVTICEPLNPDLLAQQIIDLSGQPELIADQSAKALSYAYNSLSLEVVGKTLSHLIADATAR